MLKPHVTIYTDGGCDPNPGTGGWGVVLLFDDQQTELSGGERSSTNNRMELTAACRALEFLDQPYSVDLHTDSQYVQKGITEWIKNWIRKDWKDVKNPDLWQRLDAATMRHDIKWHWLKGHAGHEHNERVDFLAMNEIRKLRGEAPLAQDIPAPFEGTIIHATSTPGTWKVKIKQESGETELNGAEQGANSYRMALVAAIAALEAFETPSKIEFYTDNETLQKGITQWIKGWIKKGWITSTGDPVKHKDLWLRLHDLREIHEISWKLRG
jgi:ribonuclease HI